MVAMIVPQRCANGIRVHDSVRIWVGEDRASLRALAILVPTEDVTN